MDRRRKLLVGSAGGAVDIATLTLEQAMLYLFDVAYWPMTEAAGNAIDHKNNFDVTWGGGVTRQATTLPNGDKIPAFDGTGQGTLYTAAFRDAFPYTIGSLMAVVQVPSVAAWENADGSTRNLFNFSTAAAELLYAAKPPQSTMRGYRNSNSYFDIGGLTGPAMIGMNWNTTTGTLRLFTNGELSLISVGGQLVWANQISTTYTRIGADTSFGSNKWLGSIGHFALGHGSLSAANFKKLYQKIFPTTRKLFIIGDSKSTGANFWPGYIQNILYTATTDIWTDGPRRYALGGYDISAMKTFIDTNLAAETETPEFILINMGTNDARAVTITPEATFKAAYNSVIASLQAKWPGVPIYCQRIYRADSAQCIANSTTINSYIDDIVAAFGGVGVYDGPDDEVWAENGDAGATYLGADHIHYSVAAHAVLAGLWQTILGY